MPLLRFDEHVASDSMMLESVLDQMCLKSGFECKPSTGVRWESTSNYEIRQEMDALLFVKQQKG